MPHEYIEFFNYKHNFYKISKTKKINFLNLAKKLKKKLSGKFISGGGVSRIEITIFKAKKF